ncbi:hypothetical protein [uncultured Shewanella sp.]|uniref:hypothetical protein n=1 Tax=uncultured Shewanella sp. TaxID=173975 RepID=UPI002632670E|nr:hypothetical protein [uncultured Shewanella sp.]
MVGATANTATGEKPKSKPIDINKLEGKMNVKHEFDFLGYKPIAENSFKLVLGASWSNTIGAYTNMKLGSSVGLTVGAKLDTSIASKNTLSLLANNYTFERVHVKFEDKETAFKRKALFGEKEEVTADETKATLSQLHALQRKVNIVGDDITG